MRNIENHDLKPMAMEEAVQIQNSITAETVTVERHDGKQVVISVALLAHHLERGFRLVDTPKPKAEEKPKREPKPKAEEPAE